MADEKKVIYRSHPESSSKSNHLEPRHIHKELNWQSYYGTAAFSNLDPVGDALYQDRAKASFVSLWTYLTNDP